MKTGFLKKWPIIKYWKPILALGLPLILSPIPIIFQTKTSLAAFTVVLMAVFWMIEIVPLAVTALIPVILYPLFGIQSSELVAKEYFKDSIHLFIGGLIMAIAFEFCGLHQRLALRVMLFTGASLRMLMLGIQFTTMFLSMWMINTAATAMMVPIILSIVEELEKSLNAVQGGEEPTSGALKDKTWNLNIQETPNSSGIPVYNGVGLHLFNDLDDLEPKIPKGTKGSVSFLDPNPNTSKRPSLDLDGSTCIGSDTPLDQNQLEHKRLIQSIKTMFLLATCYSSNIGGTGVITGTGTNLIAVEYLGNLDPKHHGDFVSLTFLTWMIFNIIPMLLNVLIAWIYLQYVFLGLPSWKTLNFWRTKDLNLPPSPTLSDSNSPSSIFNPSIQVKVQKMLETKYLDLGGWSLHERIVLTLFIFLVSTWILHDPKIIPGWSSWFPQTRVSLSTSSLLVSVLLFAIPRNPEFYQAFITRDFTGIVPKPVLEYDFFEKRFPWNVIILLGGGYAMASGAKTSGLSAAVGNSLASLKNLPPSLIQLLCMFMIGFVTEVASNSATASLLIPVLLELSKEIKVHPFYLTLPAAVTCSYAFCLPVATPPNAIAFAANPGMRVSEMIKIGFFMNCACIIVLYISTNLYGDFLFHFNEYVYIE